MLAWLINLIVLELHQPRLTFSAITMLRITVLQLLVTFCSCTCMSSYAAICNLLKVTGQVRVPVLVGSVLANSVFNCLF